MATKESTVEYIIDQLIDVPNVTTRKMFGEYAVYVGKKVVALICDDTLSLKITQEGKKFVGKQYKEGFAYDGAKVSMEVNEDLIENRKWLCELIEITEENLPEPKPKNMTKYVALLRGINVGGNKKVEMPKLKKTFESLGFSNVSTYINTGNVIFETDKKDLNTLIEKALLKTFGFEIRIVIRDAKNIQSLCKALPSQFTNDTEQKTDILFLWDEYDSKKSINLITTTNVDTLKYIDGAMVWNVKRYDLKKSGMQKFIGTVIYKNMTARNVNTVRKLGELIK